MTPLFESFLETIEVDGAEEVPYVICSNCGEALCEVEHGDTFGVLVRTAMAHDEVCPQAEPNRAD